MGEWGEFFNDIGKNVGDNLKKLLRFLFFVGDNLKNVGGFVGLWEQKQRKIWN